MKVVVDLDLHEAIQDFAVKSPAGTYEFKSQDTIDWLFYFVRNGSVIDLTSGMAIKFGMIATGDTTNTLLAYQTTFTYTTDSAGNICYECQVNFNTSQMASAITGKTQLPCTAEVRYQTSDGEIVHTLNISALVFPTILVETGVTPPGVSTGYPDASAIELLVHKNAVNGYAGLDAQGDITASVIPVDGQTIAVDSNGNIASATILAYTAANFTTPAANAMVAVTFVSTSNLAANQYVRIPIAGYYSVVSITDSTHATLKNIGDPLNAVGGVTITSGATLLPAQAVSGGGTSQGAFTQTTAAFTVPAVGATVSVVVQNTAWLGGVGYYVFVSGAGYYAVNAITDSTHVVLTNAGGPSNAPSGNNVPSGATVAAAGSPGAAGTGTAGLSAYDALSASFVMPAANATVNIGISNTAWLSANQIIYIASGGYFQVLSILSATQLTITNLPYPGNAAPGATVGSGSKVSPGGLIGPQGAGGAGLNAFTTLSANFTQPAVNATVAVTVGTTAWMATGQIVYVVGGGYYSVFSIGDLTHANLANLGYSGNAAPAATVSSGVAVTPAGLIGATGSNPYTTTTASFTMPASGSSVTVALGATAFMLAGQYVYVQGAGYFTVASITDATHAVLTNNIGATSNVASGTMIASGAGVSATGAPGPAGPAGGIGEAPTDGQIYGRKNSAWTPVTGGSGVDMQDPENGIEWTEDFIPPYGLPGGMGAIVLALPWGLQGQGTVSPAFASGLSFLQSGPEFTAIDISTGSITAIADLTMGNTANANDFCVPIGLGIATWKAKVAIDAIITSTDALVDSFGLFRYNTTEGFRGGFFFEYNYAQSANWRCCVRTGTGTTNVTYVDSGIAVTANTWFKFKVVTNAAWTSFSFYINNSLVATITTNVPTTGTDIGVAPHFLQIRSAYAAVHHFYPGYFYLNYPFTN